MMRSGFWTLGTLLGGVAMSRNAAADDYAVDLRTTHAGSLPDGFVAALTGRGGRAVWAAPNDPTTPSGKVVAQTSVERTDYRFPLLIDRNLSAKNLDLTVRLKPISGRIDRAVGMDESRQHRLLRRSIDENIALSATRSLSTSWAFRSDPPQQGA